MTLFKKFVEYKSSETGEKPEKSFASLGECMGRFVPRCTDPDVKTRLMAMESIEACLFINHVLETSGDQEGYVLQPPAQLQPAPELRRRMVTEEIHIQFGLVHQLSTVISSLLSAAELSPFLNKVRKCNSLSLSLSLSRSLLSLTST